MRRIYLFLMICASFSACKKSSSDIPDVSTFFGRFNGFIGSISNENPAIGQTAYSAINDSISPTQSNGSYTSIIAGNVNGNGFSVSFTKAILTFSGNGAPSASEFQGFFSAASVPYLSATNSNGIAIIYVDKTGNTWNSATGDQTGSVFTITNSQPSGNDVKIQSVFNCKLYDPSGNIITLTGGMFTGMFRPQ